MFYLHKTLLVEVGTSPGTTENASKTHSTIDAEIYLLQSLRETASIFFSEVSVEGVCWTGYWIVLGLSVEEA